MCFINYLMCNATKINDFYPINVNTVYLKPPIFALYAIPTPQNSLNATAATSPAHLVPCLLSPSSLGLGSSSLSFISQLAALS